MKWTQSKPARVGYYWRVMNGDPITLVYIDWGRLDNGEEFVVRHLGSADDMPLRILSDDWWWQGPFEMPKPPKDGK